jgi:ABC-type amino acid transport substrate-binding protein
MAALLLAAVAALLATWRADAQQAPASADTAHFGDRTPKLGIGDALPPIMPKAKLRVGVADFPPWSIPPSGDVPYWSGLASLVWRQAAQALQLDYEVKVYDLDGLIEAVARGEVDVAATGVPILPEHLVRFTFTPPFDQSGLSIATRVHDQLTVANVLRRLASKEASRWFLGIFVFLVAFSVLFWLAERRRNPPIEGPAARGLGESAWWGIVTLTTVGYGDRVPVTRTGKAIAASWMTIGFLLMTVSGAVVTAILTVDRLRPIVSGPEGLARVRVGVVHGSVGERYAESARLDARRFETFEDAMNALAAEELEAVVGSTTSLLFLAERVGERRIMVLPHPLMRDFIGIAVRFGLDPAIEKRLELEVVKAAQSPEYRSMRAVMMGDADASVGGGLGK